MIVRSRHGRLEDSLALPHRRSARRVLAALGPASSSSSSPGGTTASPGWSPRASRRRFATAACRCAIRVLGARCETSCRDLARARDCVRGDHLLARLSPTPRSARSVDAEWHALIERFDQFIAVQHKVSFDYDAPDTRHPWLQRRAVRSRAPRISSWSCIRRRRTTG
jgi:hypothetical protein